jgi:eukaryotic-like serine/threonine-protein kinase
MAAGKQAFGGSTSAAIFDEILHGNPPPARQSNSSVPLELDRILSRLMEKDPDLRYQTAADLRAELKRLHRDTTSGHTAAHRPAPGAESGGKKSRRWWWGVAAAIGITVIGIAWPFSRSSKYSGPPPRLVPFTSSPGDKGDPAFSPDGNEVAFNWVGEGSTDSTYHIDVQLVVRGLRCA